MSAVGFIYWGKVDCLGKQCINTKVFVLGLPICPISSIYTFSDDGLHITGIPIPIYWKSVGALFVRSYGWIPALFLINKMNPLVSDDWLLMRIGFGLYLIFYLLFAFYFAGRIPKKLRLQYLLFGKLTGYFHSPQIFPQEVAAQILKDNQRKFDPFGITPDPTPWCDTEPPVELAPFLHVYASYQTIISNDARWEKIRRKTFLPTMATLLDANSGILK